MSITAFTTEFMDDFGIRGRPQNFVPATTINLTLLCAVEEFTRFGRRPGVVLHEQGLLRGFANSYRANFLGCGLSEVHDAQDTCTAEMQLAVRSI